MSELEIACANFVRALEKHDKIMGSRTRNEILRDTYKAKTKGVLNGKVYRTVGATVQHT